jgi:hypothetical protein
LGHALCFAALLGFVANAPQVVDLWLRSGPLTFAVLQAFGVGAFAVMASMSGRLTDTFGIDRMILVGVVLQIVAALGFTLLALTDWRSMVGLCASWTLFCGALGVRGPATMARALDVEPSVVARAAGLLMFFALLIAAAAIQVVAPFLESGLMPVAWMCMALTLASGAVIWVGMSRRR